MTRARFRFAPTPSHALHLGNALAALIGWAAARKAQGAFVLRIEDIDRGRSQEAFAEDAMDAMEWLGLDWDEGPRVGGPLGPYRQSERLGRYDERLVALGRRGAVYPCTCSRADIRASQSAPHLHEGGERPYPGTCRPAGDDDGRDLRADRGGVRLHVDRLGEDAMVRWTDQWLGPQEEDVRRTCGDVLLGRAGHPTYQLAVVSDDMDMEITHVVRGIDLHGSTARQRLLTCALGGRPPQVAHHPLLLSASGDKLSKRDQVPSITSFRREGGDPQVLLATLARSVGLTRSTVRRMEAREWIDALAEPPSPWTSAPLEPMVSHHP